MTHIFSKHLSYSYDNRNNKISSLVFITGLLVYLCMSAVMLAGCSDTGVMYELDDKNDTDASYTYDAEEPDKDEVKSETAEELSSEEDKMLVVHLCGAVNNPGVYELEIDSRIIDGINKAGGFTEKASRDSLNLAMELTDGSRVYVPTVEEAKEEEYLQPQYISGNAGTEDKRVNINTADADKLMTLSGIGKTRAEAVIAYRQEHGPFKTTEEIMNVSGIGKASFEKLKEEITVE